MRTRGRRILLTIAAVAVWTLVARRLGYRLGANTVVLQVDEVAIPAAISVMGGGVSFIANQ